MNPTVRQAERQAVRQAGRERIRVLYIIDSIWGAGGAELSLLKLTRELSKRQVDCRIITFHSIESAQPFLERFSCPVEHWPLDGMLGPKAWRVATRLRKLVREAKIDIVHTFFHTADLWAGPIGKFSGAKVLISSRRDMGFRRSMKYNLCYKLLRPVFDQVQTVSEQVRQFTIRKDGIDPARTLTVYNGVDPSEPASETEVRRFREQHAIPAGAPVISCVANIRQVKGIDILTRAAALVRAAIPEAVFIVAGGRAPGSSELPHQAMIEALRRSNGLCDALKFIGPVQDVRVLLAASDLFVLPSRTEGLSNALLEGMAAGLACVATSVGGNPEVVVQGKTGLLVPPEEPEALSEAILSVLRDPDLRRRMGEAGRARVLEKFTSEAMAATVMDAYHQLLGFDRGEKAVRPARAVPHPEKPGFDYSA